MEWKRSTLVLRGSYTPIRTGRMFDDLCEDEPEGPPEGLCDIFLYLAASIHLLAEPWSSESVALKAEVTSRLQTGYQLL